MKRAWFGAYLIYQSGIKNYNDKIGILINMIFGLIGVILLYSSISNLFDRIEKLEKELEK